MCYIYGLGWGVCFLEGGFLLFGAVCLSGLLCVHFTM